MRNVLLAIALLAPACAARPARTTLTTDERSAVLAQYAGGASIDQIATQHQLDRDATRAAVHDAMIDLTRRWYRAY